MTAGAGVAPGPRIVALGGGHGLAVTLRAVAPWAGRLTAVVSTADDGGSTGRLRESWEVPALGDVRRCLAALAAPGSVWGRLLERRFDAGDLAGHPVGNLLLLALTEELGNLQAACDEVARSAGVDLERARVVPVTDDVVELHGRTSEGQAVAGQVTVAETAGVGEIWVEPACTAGSTVAICAIREADLVLLGPGSLYTSVLAAAVVGDLREALARTTARVAYVANLRADGAETSGYDVADHVAALHRHGIHPHTVIAQREGLPIGALSVDVVLADVARADGLAHDPSALGRVVASLLR